MADKARFAYDNETTKSGVVITASASATGYPAAYLLNRARWKLWRSSTTTGDQNVIVDFGSAKTVKVIALVNYRRHTGGTVKAEYWTGAAWSAFGGGTGLFTIPSTTRTRVILLWDTTGVSTTKIRVTFTNTGAVSEYVEIGACVAGTYFEPTITIHDDLDFEYHDPSANIAADDGQEIARRRTKYLGLNTRYGWVTAADKDGFLTMFDTVGTTEPLLYSIDPADTEKTVYGRLLDTLPAHHEPRNRWTIELPFLEVR